MKRTLPFPLPDGDDALFCLVRHGETDWNRDKRIQGHLDVPLNDTGRRQALAVRRALAGIPFAAHYASDLARTLETAASSSAKTRPFSRIRACASGIAATSRAFCPRSRTARSPRLRPLREP